MLEPTDTLWRYMKLSTFLLLLDGKAWLPSIATLQSTDPLEGCLGDDDHVKLWSELERQGLRVQTQNWLHGTLAPSTQEFLKLNSKNPVLLSKVLGWCLCCFHVPQASRVVLVQVKPRIRSNVVDLRQSRHRHPVKPRTDRSVLSSG